MEQLSGAALNRAIATALGYRVRVHLARWELVFGNQFAFAVPKEVGLPDTAEAAWSFAPQFDTDANAVIAILGKTHHVEFMEIDAETAEFLVCLAWLSDPQIMGYSMYYGRSSVSYQEAFARALLVALTANKS